MPSKAKPKKRKRSTLSEEEKAARRAQREAEQQQRIKEYAEKLVADWPPLTEEQIQKISVLLRPT